MAGGVGASYAVSLFWQERRTRAKSRRDHVILCKLIHGISMALFQPVVLLSLMRAK